jgi:hypothetical protein
MNFIYEESYSERLQRRRRERIEERENRPQPLSLEEQIRGWWDNLPPSEKPNPWHMNFFVKRFGVAPSKIGPALYVLGWERKREYRTDGPSRRYWVKVD